MPPEKPREKTDLHLHCDIHHAALNFGASAVRLVRDGVAAVVCPGSLDKQDAHDIEVDSAYVPFRLDLVRPSTVQEGSGAAPSRISA